MTIAKIFVALIYLHVGVTNAADNDQQNELACKKIFDIGVLHALTGLSAFRSEIWLAAMHDRLSSKRPSSQIFPLRGNEADFLRPSVRDTGHSQIISINNGPDIFRPLYDFPWAEAYHFIEKQNWQEDALKMLTEIIGRLRGIAPLARVEIDQYGFLEGMTPYHFAHPAAFNRALFRNPGGRKKPVIFHVQWNSEVIGQVEKRFYFHFEDPQGLSGMSRIIDEVLKMGPIQGALNVNSFIDIETPVWQFLLDVLDRGGSLVYESIVSYSKEGFKENTIDYLLKKSLQGEKQLDQHLNQRQFIVIRPPTFETIEYAHGTVSRRRNQCIVGTKRLDARWEIRYN